MVNPSLAFARCERRDAMLRVLTGLLVVVATLVVSPPAAAAPSDQTFVVTFDLAHPDQPGVVEAHGAITGVGAVFADERDTGSAFHESEMFVFPEGTLALRANGVTTSATFDPETCTSDFTFKGEFSITSGTGAYAGVSGHGHFAGESEVAFVGCDPTQVAGFIHGEAHGAVRFHGPGT
jgi:hypothetical protein